MLGFWLLTYCAQTELAITMDGWMGTLQQCLCCEGTKLLSRHTMRYATHPRRVGNYAYTNMRPRLRHCFPMHAAGLSRSAERVTRVSWHFWHCVTPSKSSCFRRARVRARQLVYLPPLLHQQGVAAAQNDAHGITVVSAGHT